MTGKPSYEELERRVRQLEKMESARNQGDDNVQDEQYRWLVENANELILVAQDGLIKFANKKVFDYLGYSPKEVKDRPFIHYIYPEDRGKVSEQHLKRLRGEDLPNVYPFRVVDRDGTVRWVEINAIRAEWNGKPATLSYINDITERKQAENFLRESEEKFSTAFKTSPYAITITRVKDGKFIEVNDAFTSMTGYTREETLADSSIGLKLWMNREDRDRIVNDLRSGLTVVSHEYQFQIKGNKTFMGSFSARTILLGGEHCILSSIEDITKRKQAESALRQSEDKFRTLVNTAPFGIQLTDLEGRIVYSNPAHHKMQGYGPDELIGMYIWDLMANDSHREAAREYYQTIICKQPKSTVYFNRDRTRDGREIDVKINWDYIRNENADVTGIISIVEDITDRKKDMIALHESRQLLQSMLEAIPDMVSVHDRDMTILYSNWNGFGAVSKEKRVIGTKCYHAYRGYNEICPDCQAKTVLQTRSNFETEVRLPDGKWFDLRVIPIAVIQEDTTLFLEWVRDITERKQAEEALARQQRSIQLNNQIANVFLTSSQDKVFADVLDVLLIALSSRFGYFGYIDEVGNLVCPSMTRNVWDKCQMSEKSIVFPRANWEGLWGRSLLERQTLMANENLHVPEGHVTLDNALATPIVYNDDLIGQFVVANKSGGYDEDDRDLLKSVAAHTAPILFAIQEEARRKIAHEKLENQLRQAQKMESVGRLAGGVAHDFNNMLGVILGHTEMALDDTDPASPLHAGLQAVHQAAERSAALTRQLLAFARKQTVAPKVIDINVTVKVMLKMLSRLIGEDIDLAWLPGEKVWPIKIDPSQIDQILANLCVNARDAITDRGKVTIETGSTVIDEDYCRAHAGCVPGEFTMLAVSDNGCGMDEETRSHLFEPFFTTKEMCIGTGLGLSTVYVVVKQNNGFISVYSEPGQGTTLRIFLPHHRAEEAPLPDKKKVRPIERGYETILLVEDEPTILEMTTMMLERNGYAVLAAGTPDKAIRFATEHVGDIHLLMTDVVMPEMNGRDLAKNILSIYPRLKCLFMSGYTANVIAHHGTLDEGVNFIQKPFAKADLAAKVREVLDRD